MLESEAIQKMCPIRQVEKVSFVFCQGALCMMWEPWNFRSPNNALGWVKPGSEYYVPCGDCGLKRNIND